MYSPLNIFFSGSGDIPCTSLQCRAAFDAESHECMGRPVAHYSAYQGRSLAMKVTSEHLFDAWVLLRTAHMQGYISRSLCRLVSYHDIEAVMPTIPSSAAAAALSHGGRDAVWPEAQTPGRSAVSDGRTGSRRRCRFTSNELNSTGDAIVSSSLV